MARHTHPPMQRKGERNKRHGQTWLVTPRKNHLVTTSAGHLVPTPTSHPHHALTHRHSFITVNYSMGPVPETKYRQQKEWAEELCRSWVQPLSILRCKCAGYRNNPSQPLFSITTRNGHAKRKIAQWFFFYSNRNVFNL